MMALAAALTVSLAVELPEGVAGLFTLGDALLAEADEEAAASGGTTSSAATGSCGLLATSM